MPVDCLMKKMKNPCKQKDRAVACTTPTGGFECSPKGYLAKDIVEDTLDSFQHQLAKAQDEVVTAQKQTDKVTRLYATFKAAIRTAFSKRTIKPVGGTVSPAVKELEAEIDAEIAKFDAQMGGSKKTRRRKSKKRKTRRRVR